MGLLGGLLASTFNLKGLAIAGAAALAIGGFAGWKVTDAFCDAATARAELAAERTRHEATKVDLAVAGWSAGFGNQAGGWIDTQSKAREETVNERPAQPAAADCHKLGRAGLDWLRRISPD